MHNPRRARRRVTRPAAATSVLLISGVVLAGCSDEPDAAGPAEVLAAYQDARNARDFDALRALYAEDAVITGHPLDGGDPPIADVDGVLTLEAGVFAGAETRFVDVEVSGSQATFTQLFYYGDGQCGATPGDRVTVEDGKITRYTWVEGVECDPEQAAQAGVAD